MYEDMKAFPVLSGQPALHIPLAGVSYCDRSYHIIRKDSTVAVLEYILEGEGFVEWEGAPRHVGKDSIYFLPRGQNHSYYADGEEPFTKIFMNISGPLCDRLTQAYGLSGRHFFPGSGLKPVFQRIPEVLHGDDGDEYKQAALQGILVEILARLSQQTQPYSREALELKNYMDAHTDRIVTARELARQIYRSADYCQKLFSREFGMTVYSYQLKRKMRIAQSLLEDTNMTVGEISEALGYTDAHYFSNLFKAKCGIRPLEYRKHRRSRGEEPEKEIIK